MLLSNFVCALSTKLWYSQALLAFVLHDIVLIEDCVYEMRFKNGLEVCELKFGIHHCFS